jgi:WhiB family redox-sensing transcriptional regulator
MEELLAADAKWRGDAACMDLPVDMFFPPVEAEAHDAVAICQGCRVRQACLDYAVDHSERFGIWGGLTPKERRSLMHKRRIRATLVSAPAD